MKKIMTLIGLLSMTLTIPAHADVTIIQSIIGGSGYKTKGNAVSILSPTIVLNGLTYELHTGAITAKSACEILGMDYLGFDQQDGARMEQRVRLAENGSLEFINGTRSLSVISCSKKN
ncbi:MAG: hypothetical protein J0L82_09805 [Deltaproteobacteria bacterium]|jgi:hypothetical protein|nr:hypothetical protein [Deltaproteobacteria bacterium]